MPVNVDIDVLKHNVMKQCLISSYQPSSNNDIISNIKNGYFYLGDNSYNDYCLYNHKHSLTERYIAKGTCIIALIYNDYYIAYDMKQKSGGYRRIFIEGNIGVDIAQNKSSNTGKKIYYVYKNTFDGIEMLQQCDTFEDAKEFASEKSKYIEPFTLFRFPILIASAILYNKLYFDGDDELPYHIDIIKVIRDNGGEK